MVTGSTFVIGLKPEKLSTLSNNFSEAPKAMVLTAIREPAHFVSLAGRKTLTGNLMPVQSPIGERTRPHFYQTLLAVQLLVAPVDKDALKRRLLTRTSNVMRIIRMLMLEISPSGDSAIRFLERATKRIDVVLHPESRAEAPPGGKPQLQKIALDFNFEKLQFCC